MLKRLVLACVLFVSFLSVAQQNWWSNVKVEGGKYLDASGELMQGKFTYQRYPVSVTFNQGEITNYHWDRMTHHINGKDLDGLDITDSTCRFFGTLMSQHTHYNNFTTFYYPNLVEADWGVKGFKLYHPADFYFWAEPNCEKVGKKIRYVDMYNITIDSVKCHEGQNKLFVSELWDGGKGAYVIHDVYYMDGSVALSFYGLVREERDAFKKELGTLNAQGLDPWTDLPKRARVFWDHQCFIEMNDLFFESTRSDKLRVKFEYLRFLESLPVLYEFNKGK